MLSGQVFRPTGELVPYKTWMTILTGIDGKCSHQFYSKPLEDVVWSTGKLNNITSKLQLVKPWPIICYISITLGRKCTTATHNYHVKSHRISSSFSGKLQKAIRNCSCSGTGGWKCSTTSNGICRATAWAVSSTNDDIWPSTTKYQQNIPSKISNMKYFWQ